MDGLALNDKRRPNEAGLSAEYEQAEDGTISKRIERTRKCSVKNTWRTMSCRRSCGLLYCLHGTIQAEAGDIFEQALAHAKLQHEREPGSRL